MNLSPQPERAHANEFAVRSSHGVLLRISARSAIFDASASPDAKARRRIDAIAESGLAEKRGDLLLDLRFEQVVPALIPRRVRIAARAIAEGRPRLAVLQGDSELDWILVRIAAGERRILGDMRLGGRGQAFRD